MWSSQESVHVLSEFTKGETAGVHEEVVCMYVCMYVCMCTDLINIAIGQQI